MRLTKIYALCVKNDRVRCNLPCDLPRNLVQQLQEMTDEKNEMMNQFLKKTILSLLLAVTLHVSQASADVAMVRLSLNQPAWEDPEEFPESRFGAPPNPSRTEGPSRAPASVQPNLSAVAGSRGGVQELALIAGDLGFFPKTLFVTRDVPVKLFVTGASKKPLCMMMDSFQVRKQIRSHKVEEVDFTPSAAGMFRFYCPINGMEGTLYVKDPAHQGET